MSIGLIMALASAAALLNCGPNASDSQRAGCLSQELSASDQAINVAYGALKARLDDIGRLSLRDS